MADKVHDYPVGRRSDGRQPFLDGDPDVLERGLLAEQHAHVLGRDRTPLVTDEHSIHRLRVTLGVPQLLSLAEIAVVPDSDHQCVSTRHNGSARRAGVAKRKR